LNSSSPDGLGRGHVLAEHQPLRHVLTSDAWPWLSRNSTVLPDATSTNSVWRSPSFFDVTDEVARIGIISVECALLRRSFVIDHSTRSK
jgi:hypothetical protein